MLTGVAIVAVIGFAAGAVVVAVVAVEADGYCYDSCSWWVLL